MDLTIALAMFLFALSMSISPGPINIMVTLTSIGHGAKQAHPFLVGATIGFTLLLALVGFGLNSFFLKHDILQSLLNFFGGCFIIYMGWKIMKSKISSNLDQNDIPTFGQGFLLQWVNPKGWVAAISGSSIFASSTDNFILVVFVGIYFVTCYFSLLITALLGNYLKPLFETGGRFKLLNIILGGLLIITAIYMFYINIDNYLSIVAITN